MAPKKTCPHCGAEMDGIETPLDSSWGGEIHQICFNDECCYFVNSWNKLEAQGIEHVGYRCRVDPRGACGPIPVTSPQDLKDLIVTDAPVVKGTLDYYSAQDFARDDDNADEIFYEKPRFVEHLDSLALSTVEDLFVRLIPKNSRILDLMAGPNSHLRAEINAREIIGLGLNQEELKANSALTGHVLHDVNANPKLPFEDDSFNAVVNTVSVDYMVKPVELFRDVARILAPKGIFIVVFSNRMFPPKAVGIWKRTTESERTDLVKKYFSAAELFYIDGYFESKGHPRPSDDKYYSLGIPSDPIYAVWGKVLK